MALRLGESDDMTDMAEINVTPLVDVMLVLLIIFMVTAPMLQQGLEVALPEAEGKSFELATNNPSKITITNAGVVYVDGTSNILTKPDFVDIERMRELFRTFEEKSRLIKILNECVHDAASYSGDVHVVIGREHPASSMQNCTLITAPYRVGSSDNIGTLGVVGPMRIEYARIMAMVNYMARLIEHRLGEPAAR